MWFPRRGERVLRIFPFGAFGHVHGERSREIELRIDKVSKINGILGSVQGLASDLGIHVKRVILF